MWGSLIQQSAAEHALESFPIAPAFPPFETEIHMEMERNDSNKCILNNQNILKEIIGIIKNSDQPMSTELQHNC